jgi:hypothetical protein
MENLWKNEVILRKTEFTTQITTWCPEVKLREMYGKMWNISGKG